MKEQETRGDRTRNALVQAARARFSQRGYGKTTMMEVASDAGVVEGTVYLHFGSKAGLLVAVMNGFYDDLSSNIERITSQLTPAEDRLSDLVDYWTKRMDSDWPLISVFAQQGRFRGNTEIAEALVANNRRITRVTRVLLEELKRSGLIRSDIPTRLLRDAIFGTIEHVQIGRLETGRPASLDEVPSALISLLFDGASTRQRDLESQTLGDSAATLASIDAKLELLLRGAEESECP